MEDAESDAEGARFPLCDTPFRDPVPSEERRDDVAVLQGDGGTGEPKPLSAKRSLYQVRSRIQGIRHLCRWRQGIPLILGIFLTVVALTLVVVGGIKSRQHSSIKLLHMRHPVDLKSILFLGDENFTFVQLMSLTNVALDKPAFQSSVHTKDYTETTVQHNAKKAVDGNISSCSNTGLVKKPTWHVDFNRPLPVRSIRIRGNKSNQASQLMVYVTNSSDLLTNFDLCGETKGQANVLDARVACAPEKSGRYVVVAVGSSEDTFQSLSLCEVMVFR